MENDRRLLAVLAHPDDESFGPGGTLALYAHQGTSVHLICATRGEVGETPSELLEGYEDVAKLREDELRCAATHLGLEEVHFLDYRDSGMPGSEHNHHPEALAAAPLEEVSNRIVQIIREVRPQVVITFDPIGGYHHPDHIAVHQATVEAFELAGKDSGNSNELSPYQPQKLYYHTFPRTYVRLAVKILPLLGRDPRRMGKNADIDFVDVASQSFPIHTKINIRSVAGIKEKASACHASQSGPPVRGILGLLYRLLGTQEGFMRAIPPVEGRLRERDLFEGVSAD